MAPTYSNGQEMVSVFFAIKRINKQAELHQFQKEPSYDGASISLSSLNSIGQSVFELESGNGNFDGTNRQKTDK